MTGLHMKYFILNPKSKVVKDPWANASRKAMIAYSKAIRKTDSLLADQLLVWEAKEKADETNLRLLDQDWFIMPRENKNLAVAIEEEIDIRDQTNSHFYQDKINPKGGKT